MTRILVWNLKDFSRKKVLGVGAKRKRDEDVQTTHAGDRMQIIMNVIAAVQPDIIAVVEVEVASAYGAVPDGGGPALAPGMLTSDNGMIGCETILIALRNLAGPFGGPQWMLVPPLITGPTEAVAVFFNSTNLAFSGPFVWSGGAAGISRAAGAGNYPADVRGFLPAGNVPAASSYRPNGLQNQGAARVTFTQAANQPTPGNPLPYPHRAPFMCTFYDTAGNRDVALFVVHTQANNIGAAADMTLFTQTAQIVDNIGASEVRVLCGDFNVNLMDAAFQLTAPYAALTAAAPGPAYTLGLQPLAAPPVPPNGYAGYFATHISSQWIATPYLGFYPGYRYIGTPRVLNLYAIDNILVRHGAAGPHPATNFTILNSVVGAPLLAPPAGWPAGTNTLATPLVALPGAAPGPAPPFDIGGWVHFNGWNFYGKVYSTSDHFAVAMDV